jgi:hypothetical protein
LIVLSPIESGYGSQTRPCAHTQSR